jgi:hypothetical protein
MMWKGTVISELETYIRIGHVTAIIVHNKFYYMCWILYAKLLVIKSSNLCLNCEAGGVYVMYQLTINKVRSFWLKKLVTELFPIMFAINAW